MKMQLMGVSRASPQGSRATGARGRHCDCDLLSDFYLCRSACASILSCFFLGISSLIDCVLFKSACYMRLISISMLSKSISDVPTNIYTFGFLKWPW